MSGAGPWKRKVWGMALVAALARALPAPLALAATGAFEEAIAAAGTAIELADAAGQQALVGEVRRRLQLYEQKRAYVEGTEDRN